MVVHVTDWMNSGMAIRDFARKIGVTKGKFSYWVSKVKASNEIGNQKPQFIDLGMLSESIKSENNSPEKASRPNPQSAALLSMIFTDKYIYRYTAYFTASLNWAFLCPALT